MPIRGSPNGATHTRPQPGRDRSEQVVAINRNRWSQSIGTGGRDQPECALIRAALVDDLFMTESFQGVLASLKHGVSLLCEQELSKLPPFVEPTVMLLPSALEAVSPPLLLNLTRLARARAFAQWRASHGTQVAEVTRKILQSSAETSAAIADVTPIGRKLEDRAGPGNLYSTLSGVSV